jgi:cytochrome c-type biogenesis protein CcmF
VIPELGHFCLILALVLAGIQAVFPLIGAQRGIESWMAMARPVAQGQGVFVTLAFGALAYSFMNQDFSVLNVAQNSHSQLPMTYRFTATWGSHEGSLLLWSFMLAGWTVAVTVFSRQLPAPLVARVLAVMGMISIGFLSFMLFTSNPFERLIPAAADGRDLNPLLQDIGMVIHPPLLYMGYVGFSVAFAFAIAALISGELDSTWARWSRPWTTIAWMFLTLGIALGSAWAYYELGWGGWWFWDPVENASFMPWLVGTALIHSLAVTEKRGAFKSWTVLLAISAFSLSLLGTFLVRSGVLTSVHSFASDPERGLYILAFLVVSIGASLALYAWRAPKIGLGGSFDLVSRESALLGNNVLLVVAAGSILLGTLYPLIIDSLGLGKLSVGPPYFDSVYLPLMSPLMFLMGIGPIAKWKKATLPEMAVRLRWAFGISVVTAIIVPLAMSAQTGIGTFSPVASFGILCAMWIASTAITSLVQRVRQGEGTLFARLSRPTASFYGMLLAHFGVAVFVVGVTMVRGYESEQDVRMRVGEVVQSGGYTFRFDGVREVPGPNFRAMEGTITVLKNDAFVETLHPQKRVYNASGMVMTEAAIDSGFTRDLYVSLGEPVDNGESWIVRVYHKPYIDWIWAGCFLMALGGLLAVCDRRYRVKFRDRFRKPGSDTGFPDTDPLPHGSPKPGSDTHLPGITTGTPAAAGAGSIAQVAAPLARAALGPDSASGKPVSDPGFGKSVSDPGFGGRR